MEAPVSLKPLPGVVADCGRRGFSERLGVHVLLEAAGGPFDLLLDTTYREPHAPSSSVACRCGCAQKCRLVAETRLRIRAMGHAFRWWSWWLLTPAARCLAAREDLLAACNWGFRFGGRCGCPECARCGTFGERGCRRVVRDWSPVGQRGRRPAGTGPSAPFS